LLQVRDWTTAHAQTVAGKTIQKKILHATLGPVHVTLDEFRYAVRCFFYMYQQLLFREEPQIADPTTLGRKDHAELELRFLLLLFRKGVSRHHILFDRNDVCNIIRSIAE